MSTTQSANLASSLEDVFTVTLRIRHRRQPVADAAEFRREIRLLLRRATERARFLGYTGASVQKAIFAVVAFLDESILNLADPIFGDWSRRPLQEELFGGHLAGETFYQDLRACLEHPNSSEVADVLEVHCLCLLLGYRGRYAFGGNGAVEALLHQARETLRRFRGEARLTTTDVAPALPPSAPDSWSRRLLWVLLVLFSFALITFVVYQIVLTSGVHHLQNGYRIVTELS